MTNIIMFKEITLLVISFFVGFLIVVSTRHRPIHIRPHLGNLDNIYIDENNQCYQYNYRTYHC